MLWHPILQLANTVWLICFRLRLAINSVSASAIDSSEFLTLRLIACEEMKSRLAASIVIMRALLSILTEKNLLILKTLPLSLSISRRLADWRQRSAIEPIIDHTKIDHGLDRNYLKSRSGDRINTMLNGCGFNLRTLLRTSFLLIFHSIIRVILCGKIADASLYLTSTNLAA